MNLRLFNRESRRPLIRLALGVLWVCLGVLLFIFFRGHTLLVDNRNLENEGIRAPDLIKVTVDGTKTMEFFRGDRDIFDLGGGRHRIRVEFSDGTPPVEKTFALALMPDMFILSIPRMTGGLEPFVEVFSSEPSAEGEGPTR